MDKRLEDPLPNGNMNLQRLLSQAKETAATRPEDLLGLPLTGQRIMVRLFTLSDETNRQTWAKFSEPHLAKYNFARRDGRANAITHQRLKDRIRLALDEHGGQLVGYVSLKSIAGSAHAAEMGICFAADQVEKGYGSETLTLVLPWAARRLDLQRIVLHVDAINARAIHLYDKFGFCKVEEIWLREDSLTLRAHLKKTGLSAAYRWKNRHLEVLNWIMEWKPDSSGAA